MNTIRLETDRGNFCFESEVDAHAFEDKLGIKCRWHITGYEDTKYFGGMWAMGSWKEAVTCYEKNNNDPYPWRQKWILTVMHN